MRMSAGLDELRRHARHRLGSAANVQHGRCGTGTVFTPSNSSADQSGHVFNVNGLTPGATYVAQVTVTGYNGQPTTKRSAAFTIPRGQTNTDKVFTEVEPNDDWQYPNAVPNDGTNVFRGATSGGDNDWFHVQVPEGKSVCVAGAITNNNTTCTTGLTLYNDIQGSIAGGNGNRLLSSRSAITSSDYVCRSAPAAPYNFALVNVEAPGLVCPINYDIFIVPSRAKRQRRRTPSTIV